MSKRSDYGKNPHSGADRNNAKARGWGSGWPNCQRNKMTTVQAAGVTILVRKEIAPLVGTLLRATELLGYNVKNGQTWGFACRPIRGTESPSNHSWGLAVDLNSVANPMSSRFQSDIPPVVVHMWEACGFYWGGRYENRPDPMHFEYLGGPDDVMKDFHQAQKYLTKGDTKSNSSSSPWKYYNETAKPGSRVIRRWDRGDDVRYLQDKLDVEVDGYFGTTTEQAVRVFQGIVDLKIDGIVGKNTWRHLT